MSHDSKFNVGQYGFKPWMANLLMGLIELVMVIFWFIGSFLAGIQAIFTFNLSEVEKWDKEVTFLLIGGYLVWNLLVWVIKPLRTKFNNSAAWANLAFIAWLLYDCFIAAA